MKAPVCGRRRISALALGLPLTAALVAAAQPAGATSPGYLLSIGVGTSDNIRRVPTDEESETLAIAGLQLDWRERTARTQTDVLGDLSYVDYLQNTFGSEVVGNATGRFSYAIAPERESVVTIVFNAVGSGTELDFRHEQFFDQAARDGHQRGWSGALAKLDDYLRSSLPVS